MTYHQGCTHSNMNMMGATRGAGTVYPSEHMSLPPVFNVIRVARSLIFCLVYCILLSVLLAFFFCLLNCLSIYSF